MERETCPEEAPFTHRTDQAGAFFLRMKVFPAAAPIRGKEKTPSE
jgi:hypothetical protein